MVLEIPYYQADDIRQLYISTSSKENNLTEKNWNVRLIGWRASASRVRNIHDLINFSQICRTTAHLYIKKRSLQLAMMNRSLPKHSSRLELTQVITTRERRVLCILLTMSQQTTQLNLPAQSSFPTSSLICCSSAKGSNSAFLKTQHSIPSMTL